MDSATVAKNVLLHHLNAESVDSRLTTAGKKDSHRIKDSSDFLEMHAESSQKIDGIAVWDQIAAARWMKVAWLMEEFGTYSVNDGSQ